MEASKKKTKITKAFIGKSCKWIDMNVEINLIWVILFFKVGIKSNVIQL